MTPNRLGLKLLVAAIATAALLPMPALAGDGDVEVSGTCTRSSSVKLKLSEEDGRIEVELEVDENRNGRVWTARLLRNGKRVFLGKARTRGPSGSFELRRVVAGGSRVRIAARAVSPSGEVCRAAATYRAGTASGDDESGDDS